MRTPHDYENGVSDLKAVLAEGSVERHVYVLADGLLIPNLPQTLFGDFEIEAFSLMPGMKEGEGQVWPYVFCVSNATAEVWNWLVDPARGTTILFCLSNGTLFDVYQHMIHMTQAIMPDGSVSWFRFYDPEALFPVLSAPAKSEWGHFFGKSKDDDWLIAEWLGVNEFGELYRAAAPQEAYSPPKDTRIHITPTQIEALDEAYFRRIVRLSIIHMQKRYPEKFEKISIREASWIENAVDDAFLHNLKEAIMVPLYVECAYKWGMNFVSLPWAADIFNNPGTTGYLRSLALFEKLHEGEHDGK